MIKIYRSILIFCFLIFGLHSGIAQHLQDDKEPGRFYVGGNFGIQFGTVTLIDVSPLLGYRLTEKLSIGAGISYLYYRDARFNPVYSTNIYGGRAFIRHYLFKDIFAHAEYELLNFEVYDWNTYEYNRKYVSGVLVGGGYRQWLGPRFFMNILVLWNINETIDYPYSNPIFRVGIGTGL